MISKLKNWWVEILAFIVVVLDQGLEAFEPILAQIGAPDKAMNALRVIFGAYGIFVLIKNRLPTQNPEKLQKIASDAQDNIVGDRPMDRG